MPPRPRWPAACHACVCLLLVQEFSVRLGEFPALQRPPEGAGAHLAGEGADFALDQIVGETLVATLRSHASITPELNCSSCSWLAWLFNTVCLLTYPSCRGAGVQCSRGMCHPPTPCPSYPCPRVCHRCLALRLPLRRHHQQGDPGGGGPTALLAHAALPARAAPSGARHHRHPRAAAGGWCFRRPPSWAACE